MRTIVNNSYWTITAFDTPAWTKSKCIVKITQKGTYIGNTVSASMVVSGSTVFSASYIPKSGGTLTIDLTDIVRAYASGSVSLTCSAQSATVAWTTGGLQNPYDMIIPYDKTAAMLNELLAEDVDYTPLIVMPRMILQGANFPSTYYQGGYNASIIIPIWQKGVSALNALTLKQYNENGVAGMVMYMTTGIKYIAGGYVKLVVDDDADMTYNFRPLDCSKQYATVYWVSRTGQAKQHTWEVLKVSENVDGSTQYMTDDGTFDIRKKNGMSFVLHIDGLTAYDYWYYADIITSDDVRVSFSEDTQTESISGANNVVNQSERVEVLTDEITVPDSNEWNTLEVEVKYKEYDEV